jgi:GTP-binding protein HflX
LTAKGQEEGVAAILVTYPRPFTLQEAQALAEAAGYRVVKLLTQRYLNHPTYGVGSGKAQEVRRWVEELGAEVVLVDERLRSSQIYNLAKVVKVPVIDREKLILEIFYRRASTAEAKLQVRLAELRYELPRAREKVRLAKQGEQPGFYGLGGYEVDVYYRDVKRRAAAIARRLRAVRRRRALQRTRRLQLDLPLVSLAGYTGAGKTTLFNQLTGEERPTDRGVFTTLTTAIRRIRLGGFKALLSDTVGFISRLPPYMIEAFKSTLEELTHATLVLLVVDVSEPPEELALKYRSCAETLAEIGVSPGRVMVVLNKVDLVGEEEAREKARHLGLLDEEIVALSAKTGQGLDRLRELLQSRLFDYVEERVELKAEVLPSISERVDWLKTRAEVKLYPQEDGTLLAVARGPSWAVSYLKQLAEVK